MERWFLSCIIVSGWKCSKVDIFYTSLHHSKFACFSLHSWWPVAYRSNCPWFFKDVFVPIPLFLPSLFPIFSSFSLTSEPLMYCCRAMPLCTLLLNMPSIKTRYLTFDLVLPWMKDFIADAWQWLFSGQVTSCLLVGMSLSKAVYRVAFTILSRSS